MDRIAKKQTNKGIYKVNQAQKEESGMQDL